MTCRAQIKGVKKKNVEDNSLIAGKEERAVKILNHQFLPLKICRLYNTQTPLQILFIVNEVLTGNKQFGLASVW